MSITTLRDEARNVERVMQSTDLTSTNGLAVLQIAQLGRIVQALEQIDASVKSCDKSLSEIELRLRYIEYSYDH